MKGANIELKQVDTHERLLLPRNSTAKKPQASGPARKRAKKKTHSKRTQKAGTPGNRLHKGIGEQVERRYALTEKIPEITGGCTVACMQD